LRTCTCPNINAPPLHRPPTPPHEHFLS
jgi:hypothetical protein